MKLTRWPLVFLVFTSGVLPPDVLAGPSLTVEETSWSRLESGAAAVDYSLSLGQSAALRAVEVRVLRPDDPSLALSISPRSSSEDMYVLPVKSMNDPDVMIFALVFPGEVPAGTGAMAIGTFRCDLPMEAARPSVEAFGLLRDGRRIEIPVEYTTATERLAPVVSPRLFLSPNPTKGTVELRYTLRASGMVEVSVYDVSGRKLATVASGPEGAGDHHRAWDTRDDNGHEVPAGIYFVGLRTAAGVTMERLSIVR